MVKDSVTIGRGGIAYPVDIRIASSPDVSREHARIRRDPKTGRFFLIDSELARHHAERAPRAPGDTTRSMGPSARTEPKPRCPTRRESASLTPSSSTSGWCGDDVAAVGAVDLPALLLIALVACSRGRHYRLGGRTVSGAMAMVSVLRAAGDTDPGLQREVNEDRFHFDLARGLFMVIDGVGGQAAGGKAADTAVSMLSARLERETGPVVDRAARGHHRSRTTKSIGLPRLRPEWNGMACVLTVVVRRRRRARSSGTSGTRGCTRFAHGRIEKVTRDHSPVGEREDAHELSELEAMHHPRRNEVYRDVGSERHEAGDPDFVDIQEIPFEPDAALLLCSDGLTDLVDSTSINQIVARWAGRPQQVVRASDRRRERRRRERQRHRCLRRGRAVRATGRCRCVSEITRRLSTGQSAAQLESRQLRTMSSEPHVEASAGGPLDAARAAHDRHRACRCRSEPLAPLLGRTRSARSGRQHRHDRRAADGVDRGGAAERRRRDDDRRRARRVSRNADAQELRPPRQPSSARRAHPAAGQRRPKSMPRFRRTT